MKSVLEKFFNLKLRIKLFLSFLIIIFISVIMVNYVTYKLYEADTINKSVSLSQNLVDQLSYNISYKTKTLEDNIILKIQAAQLFSDNSYSESLLNVKRTDGLSKLTTLLSGSGVDIKEIFMQDASSRGFFYEKNDPSNNEFQSTNIYKYIKNNSEAIRNKWGAPVWVTFSGEAGIVYIVRSVIDIDTLEYRGIIGIGISEEYFRSLYSSLEQANNGSIVIYNNSGNIISAKKEILAAGQYFKDYNANDGNSAEQARYKTFEGNKYIITGSVSDDKKWKVLYIASSQELLKNALKIKIRIIIVCLISIVVALIIAIIISGSITSNIRLLLKKIRSVGQGNFSVQIEPKYTDEVGELFQEFNVMSAKLNDLIERIAFEQVEKQKSEYNALQAQINPHFLYNTLETINSFAKIKGQDDIVKIIQSLSFLLRMSISGKRALVKLSEEVDYVKNYLSIEKIILGDRISVEYDIDREVLDCQVPKLILQPIVENAILHGIEGMRQGGLIIISAHKDEKENLLINISDNGKGMGGDAIRRLLEEPEEGEEANGKHTRIGIRSVNRRIKILYGEEYGIKVSSEENIGTVVEIIIPLNKK